MSQTRKRFNEKKKQKRAQRKRAEGQIVCQGKVMRRNEEQPCGWGIYPRNFDMDEMVTCPRCYTGHIMTGTGWQTFKDAKAKSRWPQGDSESWVR